MTGLSRARRAIVTGGASGIGLATCRRLVAEGARVAILDVQTRRAQAAARELGGLAFAADVGDAAAVEQRDARRPRASSAGSICSSTTRAQAACARSIATRPRTSSASCA